LGCTNVALKPLGTWIAGGEAYNMRLLRRSRHAFQLLTLLASG
jgi:hypothetical protein